MMACWTPCTVSDPAILMRNCFLLLFLLSAPAMANDAAVETVTAHGSTLIGLWQIETPRTAKPVPGVNWHPQRRRYCRVTPDGDDLAVACLDSGIGSASLDGDNLHFAWGSMLARTVVDARLLSATRFEGSSQIKLTGAAIGSDDITTGTKLTLTPDMPDSAAKAGLLAKALAQLQAGALSEPHTPASHFLQAPSPEAMRKLGAVKTVTYLGDTGEPYGIDGKPFLFIFNTYVVAFANGERLCGIHQREDGVMDGLRCA